LICFEEAIKIIELISRTLHHDTMLRFELGKHRDSHMGAQAIHLASATGNRFIIDLLIDKYGADPREKTSF
jgi:hypothetical protein